MVKTFVPEEYRKNGESCQFTDLFTCMVLGSQQDVYSDTVTSADDGLAIPTVQINWLVATECELLRTHIYYPKFRLLIDV